MLILFKKNHKLLIIKYQRCIFFERLQTFFPVFF